MSAHSDLEKNLLVFSQHCKWYHQNLCYAMQYADSNN